MIEKPQILTLNLSEKSNALLIEKGFNIYPRSLGKLVDTKNKKHEFKYHLLNYDFPANSHEYDIIIIDFSNDDIIDYIKEDNTREKIRLEITHIYFANFLKPYLIQEAFLLNRF